MKMRIGAFLLAGFLISASAFAQADLSLSKSVSGAAPNVGDTITFTVTLLNGGPNTATSVVVTDQLPSGLTFVSATPSQGTYNSATGVWTVGTVTTGALQTLQITATVSSASPQTNTATISASGVSDPNTANNSASVTETPQQADLLLGKTVSNPAPNVGDTINFMVTIADSGPNAATNVTVQDLLPAGLTFVSATPSQGTYNSLSGVWTVGGVSAPPVPTLQISATVTSPGTQTNTASVSHSDQFDPNTANNVASASETPQQADLGLTKTVSNPAPNVGDTISYTVTLSNAGPDIATNVTVQDTLPVGVSFVSATPSQGTYNSGSGVWVAGNVPVGAAPTLQISAMVTSPAPLGNTASISHSDQFDPNVNNNSDTTSTNPASANLSLMKSVNNPTPNVGSQITYTITLTNSGPAQATNVTVTDVLPPGLTFSSATPSQGTYNSGTGVWTVGTVAIGPPQTLQIVATVASPSMLTNTATISHSDQPDANDANNIDSVSETPQQSDLGLTKTITNLVPNTGSITFTVTLSNAGPGSATNVTVQDLLPAGLTFVSASPSQGAYNSTTGVWTVGTVTTSTPPTLQITATIVSAAPQTNSASISHSDQFDPNPGNNIATATEAPQPAELAVTKTPSTPTPVIGSSFTWTVTLTNNGPNPATNVTVQDTPPAGVGITASTPSQGSYNPGTGVWTVGTVNPGASLTLVLQFLPASPAGTVVTNTATVSHSDQLDTNTTNNSASSTVTITAQPADLGLTKTVDNATPNVGSNVTFTVTLRNFGPGGATAVSVSDLLPAGLTFVSATPSQGTYNAGTGVWTVGNVANGATATLAIHATVTGGASATNTATISAANEPDPNSANNTASATVTPPSADIAVTKTTSTATPVSGANFTWTVTVTNNGPNAATSVTVSDAIPAGVTFVSATPSQGTYAAGVWTIGSLASGSSVTLALTVTAGAAATKTNTASVSHSDQFDANTANNSASSTVTIAPGADIPALSPFALLVLALTLMALGATVISSRS